VTIDQLLISK